MVWHSSGVQEPEFELSGYFSEFLIKLEKWNLQFELAGIRVIRVKMFQKWGGIQGKTGLVRVSGEFEQSEYTSDVGSTVF